MGLLQSIEWQAGLGVGLLMLAATFFFSSLERSVYEGFKIIGLEEGEWGYAKAKQRYMADGGRMLEQGLKLVSNYPSHVNGPFQIVTTAGPKIVLPGRYMEEIKSNDDLEFPITTHQQFFGDYPGLELFRETNNQNIVQDATRIKLTQALGRLTPELNYEADAAIKAVIGDSEGHNDVILYPAMLKVVAQTSARTFTGPVLCRDPAWIELSMNYAVMAFDCARILRLWNPLLRPVVHWFLPEMRRIRKMQKQARMIIEGEIARRISPNASGPGSREGPPNDAISWVQESARGRAYDPTDAQLTLTFAAIHTTTDLLTKALFDLAAHPEIIEPLREEMSTCMLANGFTKASLYNMKLLDSFLKESQRLNPSSKAPCSRLAMKTVILKDGTRIPKGANITVTSDRLWDSSVYAEPEKFDPYRFLKLRAIPGQENSWQFVTTSTDHIGFGHGTYACPGRFFASNEAKIIMCHLLLKYDISLVGRERPQNFWIGAEYVPPVASPLRFARRRDLEGPLSVAK